MTLIKQRVPFEDRNAWTASSETKQDALRQRCLLDERGQDMIVYVYESSLPVRAVITRLDTRSIELYTDVSKEAEYKQQ